MYVSEWGKEELLQANGIAPLAQRASGSKKRPSKPSDGRGDSHFKRPRTHEVQCETPEVKPEPSSDSDDEDEDDVTFLEVSMQSLKVYFYTKPTMFAGATCNVTKAACGEEGQEESEDR